MNKKGSGAAIALWILVVVAIVGVGYMTDWFGFTAEAEPTGGTTTEGKEGDLGSLKYSAKTITEDSPIQFPTTGYCWDVAKPKELIESSTGKTTSGTAGTTFSPSFRDQTYECTAFDNTHFCEHASDKMTKEGLQLRSTCRNTTIGPDMSFYFYESGTLETSNSLTVGAGATKCYNKWALEVNVSNENFEIGAVCLGTNVSDSNVKVVTLSGWGTGHVPADLGGKLDDYCFTPPAGTGILTDFDFKDFTNSLCFESDGDALSGTSSEAWRIAVLPACEYASVEGDIKKGYYDDSPSQSLCNAGTRHNTTITLV